ncbi:MAG: hypothetical protein GY801_39095 [bacterium]|nr:hypothetical protein [bacterium]
MKISMKLSLVFLILVVVIGVTGGAGLFFATRIQTLSAVATPLVKISGELVITMQRAIISFLELSNLQDEEQIQVQANTFAELEEAFRKKLDQLSGSIVETKSQLDTQTIEQLHHTFFTQAREGITAHQEMLTLQNAAVVGQKLEAVETQRQELDTLLADFANRNEATINEKEDGVRTLEQSGAATTEEVLTLFLGLLNQDYPLVQGTFKLQRYLIQLQDISRTYLAEQNPEELPAIEKEFARIVKLSNSRLKRLKPRAKSEENSRDVQQLGEGLTKLNDLVLAEDGLFAAYRENLRVGTNVKRLQ